jgi:hypothetical protein
MDVKSFGHFVKAEKILAYFLHAYLGKTAVVATAIKSIESKGNGSDVNNVLLSIMVSRRKDFLIY